MNYQKHLETVKSINDQFRYNKTLESMFELDQWSALPTEGGAYRQQVAAYVGMQKAGLFDSADAKAAAEYFSGVTVSEIEDYIERGGHSSFELQEIFLLQAPHLVPGLPAPSPLSRGAWVLPNSCRGAAATENAMEVVFPAVVPSSQLSEGCVLWLVPMLHYVWGQEIWPT